MLLIEKQKERIVYEDTDWISSDFDKPYGTIEEIQRHMQILVINKMQIKKGMRILDLACGSGWGTFYIASKLDGTGTVTGLDSSKKTIEKAQKELKKCKYYNVEFLIGKASSIPYNDYFNYVICTNTYHLFHDKRTVLYSVLKSLKKEGIFIIQDICDDYLLMRVFDFYNKVRWKAYIGSSTANKLRHLFNQKNFRDIEIEKIKLNRFWGMMIGYAKR